ncbi:hypothetical protein ACJ73_07409 [Blastomyces percursus]|uniref:Uncharacterized protein n=1 Tax=Blastomyces percursus TaxID=1658174 RepID=A0A1J9PY47_9EURO|nr:hypothetical protein ACJ73_07409 [Blastomyces percursus]
MAITIPDLPATRKEWHQLARMRGVESIPIHQIRKLESASKIKEEQFLALRVLWTTNQASEIDLEKEYNIKYRAEDAKDPKWNKHWMSYIKEVTKGLNGSADLGTFDMLYDFQREISNLQPGPQETKKIFFGAITRARSRHMEPNPIFPPSTPTRAPKAYTSASDVLGDGMVSLNIGDETPFKTPKSDGGKSIVESVSPVTTEEAKLLPLVKDEQIVNTALILFLRGLCLRMSGLEEARWSIERKAFHFGQQEFPEKKSLYEARTDGHFSLITEDTPRSLSILEVKAQARKESKPWMQESAQMAAWIYDEPYAGNDSVQNFRRCMITQDRHEIYLIIATYDENYVAYLQEKPLAKGADSFLQMHQIGPFTPTAEGHMERLGRIIVALTRQLVNQAKKGRPCFWY